MGDETVGSVAQQRIETGPPESRRVMGHHEREVAFPAGKNDMAETIGSTVFGTDVQMLQTLPARLAAFAPKLTALLEETGDYAQTMQILSPYERMLVRRLRRDFSAGRTNVYTRVMRREAPWAEALLVAPPKSEPLASSVQYADQREPAGVLIIKALERFQTGERILGMDSETLADRRICHFIQQLPEDEVVGAESVGTVSEAVRRLYSLSRSDYKEARRLAAKEAGRLLAALEEVVLVSARLVCPIEITRVTAGAMMREKARSMKAQKISVPRIASKMKRSHGWAYKVTAEVAAMMRQTPHGRPLWEGMGQWERLGVERLKLAIREADLDFAVGMDATMGSIGTLSKGSGHLHLESRDVAKLATALDWLEAETPIERTMGVIRLRVRDRALATGEAGAAAAAGLGMLVTQVAKPMVFRGKSRVSCDRVPTKVGLVVEFQDEDAHEMLAGLQAAKRQLRIAAGVTTKAPSVREIMTHEDWTVGATAWAGDD